MKSDLFSVYREFRKPICPKSYPGKMYVTPARTALQQARFAIEADQVKAKFEELGGEFVASYERDQDSGGFVRIVEFPEEGLTVKDLEGDMFNPEANPDINPNILKRERADYIAMIEREGIWLYVAEFWNGSEWEQADTIGGFEGWDSFHGSGYDADLMRAAIEGHEKTIAAEALAIEATRPDMYQTA